MKTLIAIDPGIEGAIAVFVGGKLQKLYDMPTLPDCEECRLGTCNKKHKSSDKKKVDAIKIYNIIRDEFDSNKDLTVVVEKVWGMKGDTPTTAFRLGAAYQTILAVTEILEIKTHLVAAVTWKSALSLIKIKKDETTAYAADLFENHSFYTKRGRCLDGRGDAALIGFYAVGNIG